MSKSRLTIEAFQKLLNEPNTEANTLVSILQSLTEVKDSRQLIGDIPSPLGAWSGWS